MAGGRWTVAVAAGPVACGLWPVAVARGRIRKRLWWEMKGNTPDFNPFVGKVCCKLFRNLGVKTSAKLQSNLGNCNGVSYIACVT